MVKLLNEFQVDAQCKVVELGGRGSAIKGATLSSFDEHIQYADS